MTQVFNKEELKKRRKYLRNNMTKPEAVIWNHIKNKQVFGQRFLRQYSVNNYIIDFYCPKLKLGIEIDGNFHFINDKSTIKDFNRAEFLLKFKIELIRFTNLEVIKNIDGVCNEIFNEVEKRLNPPAHLL